MARPPTDELTSLEQAGLLRVCHPLDSPAGPTVIRDGRTLHNFSSNDYLGLALDPRLTQALHEGLDRWGHGATASRLLTGTQPPHVALESRIAEAKGTEAAVAFSSGHAAALGTIPALVGKGDHVILDKLAHACLIDGALLSNATLRVFPHNDLNKLERLLTSIRARDVDGRILIVTESVFSMDGDLCPLREILRLKEQHDALLLLDEAHAFGVLGPSGMGLAEELGVQSRVDFHMGTLGKAAALAGAYLACSSDWRDLLVNRARSFIYSTAPPPALAHAAAAALDLIRCDDGKILRARLRENIELLAPNHPSPIIPIIFGENESTLHASAALESAGFLVPAIRFPTVPRGTARLRISLSAAHPPQAVTMLRRHLGSPDL